MIISTRVLGQSVMPVLHVERGGQVLRGLALPFGPPGAVVAGPRDSLVLEMMDEESVESIATDLPLLISHDRDKPAVGVVRSAAIGPSGVGIEAKLVGSDDEIQGWERRFRHGLSAGLSVGFVRDAKRTVYESPQRRGALPVMRPRGVRIVECSLVMWPAYGTAGVTSLSVRSAADQQQHEESERTIVEAQRFLAEFAVRQARKRGD